MTMLTHLNSMRLEWIRNACWLPHRNGAYMPAPEDQLQTTHISKQALGDWRQRVTVIDTSVVKCQ